MRRHPLVDAGAVHDDVDVAERLENRVGRLVNDRDRARRSSTRNVRRPRASISAATSSTSGARRAVATTSAPASASPSASTRPMPLVPPTTTATRPSRLKRFFDMTRGQVSMSSHAARHSLPAATATRASMLQRRGDGGARELTTWRLAAVARATKQQSHTPGEESVLVVQNGAASVTVAGQDFDVSRKDVFEERASAVYAPPDESITVSADIRLRGDSGVDPGEARRLSGAASRPRIFASMREAAAITPVKCTTSS